MNSAPFSFDPTVSSAVPAANSTRDGALRRESSSSAWNAVSVVGPLAPELLRRMHRYWMAANYLTVGQIFLQDNPLLREPLRPSDIKPRLLGHWGTSPGLSLLYVHLNRLIVERDADIIFLAGPGHGGPAVVANVYLEGTYTEVYPDITRDVAGLRRLFRQFSTPGGIPSHVGAATPGSIHEGGELGYVLAHAFGAAFDNPNLIVVAAVGDGEAETAPLEGAWKSTSFLNPARDGAVLPVLHLNGYKISGPTVLSRTGGDNVTVCSRDTATRYMRSQAMTRWTSISIWPPRSTECLLEFGQFSRKPARSAQRAFRRPDGRRSCCERRRVGRDRGW